MSLYPTLDETSLLSFTISLQLPHHQSTQPLSTTCPHTPTPTFTLCLAPHPQNSPIPSTTKPPTTPPSTSPRFTIRLVQLPEVRKVADMCSEIFSDAEREHPWTQTSFFGAQIPFLGLFRGIRHRLIRDETRSHLLRRVWRMLQGGTGKMRHRVLVAESDDGELCGCVELGVMNVGVKEGYEGPEEKKAYLGNLGVRKKWRRLGLGGLLVEGCCEAAVEWGFREVFLHVDDDNLPARRFYGRLGYSCVSQEPVWYRQVGRSRRLLLRKGFWEDGEVEGNGKSWDQAPIVDSRKLNVFEYLLYCIRDLEKLDT